MAKTATKAPASAAQEYEWTKEVFGRQPKQIETIDPAKERRLTVWLAAGLVVKKGDPWPEIHPKKKEPAK